MLNRGLPEFFRNSKHDLAKAVRYMSEMQRQVLLHFTEQAEFLKDMQDISTLTTMRKVRYYPYLLILPDKVLWGKLSAKQKENMGKTSLLIDPVTLKADVKGLTKCERITGTLLQSGFNLNEGFDYSVSDGKITFLYELDGELWDRVPVTVTLYGVNTVEQVSALWVLLENSTWDEDWYYRRAGILVGVPEHSTPAQHISAYRLALDGPTENNIDALLAAYTGRDIALRNETLYKEEGNLVSSDKSTYEVPLEADRTMMGTRLIPGDRLFKGVYVINDLSHRGWLHNDRLLKLLRDSDPEFDNKLRRVVGDGDIEWGRTLPARILDSPDDPEKLGLWLGAPIMTMPVMDYKIGSEVVPEYSGGTNMVIYNTMDTPGGYIEVDAVYDPVTGAVAATVEGVPESTELNDSDIFTFSNGVSGRVFDKTLPASWEGDLSQDIGTIEVEAVAGGRIIFKYSKDDYNEYMNPEIGDWVYIGVDGEWVKVQLVDITRDSNGEYEFLHGLTYGLINTSHPLAVTVNAGNYPAISYRSFDGKPYSGHDEVRVNAFEELASSVLRHIDLLVINGAVYDEAEVNEVLGKFRDRMNLWKARVVISVPDKEIFTRVREV